MVLGGCLVPETKRENLVALHSELCTRFGKHSLHCSELNHYQVAYFARTVASRAQLKLFAFVSKKETLHSYRQQIAGGNQAQFYYNKCAQFLLEQVGSFLGKHGISRESVSVVFEEREGHDYQRLRAYIRTIIRNPIDHRARALAHIDPLSITSAGKRADPLFGFADLTAYSAYQAVNFSATNFELGEQRYLRELEKKFYADPATGCIADHGLKMMK